MTFYQGCHHMHSNKQLQQDKVKNSSRSDRSIGTAWDKESRKKTSTKTSLTSEAMDRRDANTSLKLTKVHTILMLNEAST